MRPGCARRRRPVLKACARASTLSEARDRAYAAVDAVHFPDGFCRRDIGGRALG